VRWWQLAEHSSPTSCGTWMVPGSQDPSRSLRSRSTIFITFGTVFGAAHQGGGGSGVGLEHSPWQGGGCLLIGRVSTWPLALTCRKRFREATARRFHRR